MTASRLMHFDKTGATGYDDNIMIPIIGILSMRKAGGRLLSALVLIGVCPALLACQSHIEVVQPLAPPPAPIVSVATVAPSEHAMAIIGVEFDPPLDYDQIVSNGGVTLLVAVQNLGLSAEPRIEVRARLVDPAANGMPAELLDQTLAARSLAPGEVGVVRFGQVTDLPLRERYQLVIDLMPVPGEWDLSDNARRYDILVHGMQ